MSKVTVRPAETNEAPAIADINNHCILHTVLTFTTEEKTPSATSSLLQDIRQSGLPFIVAEDTDTRTVVGYCYVAQYREGKPAYAHTLELTLFCHAEWVRQGVGLKLLRQMTSILKDPRQHDGWVRGTRLTRLPARQLLAVVAVDVQGPKQGMALRDWSVNHGFEQVGHLKAVGYKKQRWVDVLMLQLVRGLSTGLIPSHGCPAALGQHISFACDGAADLDEWRTHLRNSNVDISGEMSWERGGTSIYFRDPEGHLLEIMTRGVWPVY